MDAQSVNMFLQANADKFPDGMIPILKEKLLATDQSKEIEINALSFKSPIVALLFSLFLGYLGVDRFYIGDTGLGVGKLLTCGGGGIWSLIDWFMIWDATRQKNVNKLMMVL